MTYYHFTCSHSASGIDAVGKLLPAIMLTERPVPWTGRVVWVTDMATPDRFGLGLTSFSISCDRTEHRYRVTDPTEVMPWSRYARLLPRDQRDELEMSPGARPAHWYVSVCALPVIADPIGVAA